MVLKKKKVLVLSDHALSTSGVGVQTRHLINGLLKKGDWTFRQFGAAMKHDNYDTIQVSDDFIIRPIDGFGTPELLRVTLATEKPDLLLLFTDPRFFIWAWEMEDEIHQVCPIAYWHVWDNRPTPKFNEVLYKSTDLLNCHSYPTYEMCKELVPDRVNFVPHALPGDIYRTLPADETMKFKKQVLGEKRKDHFVVFWINRNARRKRAGDLLWAWKEFMTNLKDTHGKSDASLLLHTDPVDREGQNLYEVADMLGIRDSVVFSKDRLDFEQINVLHNISDVCINVSYAEGFGLSTLEAMQVGKPIIAVKTGGLTRQVIDHRDNTENGVGINVELTTLVGSQQVPYIFEDLVSHTAIADAITKMYEASPEERARLGQKAKDYVASEFSYQNTIDLWHDTMNDTILNWRDRYQPWTCKTI
jgi:glycosyltransferase involved in cell wall biosynthesis